MLLTNQDDWLDSVITNGSLKHSSDKLVGFKILLSMLKTSSRLDFGRANFSSPDVRNSMGSIHGWQKNL